MIRALHDISIGDFHFATGEVIHAEAQELLPRRRLEQLKSGGRVEEITSELELARVVSELLTRVEALEAAAKPEAAPVAEVVATAASNGTKAKTAGRKAA
jgi:transcriptional antiterminator Rof (Rho-off)